jgi:hypothetical protein
MISFMYFVHDHVTNSDPQLMPVSRRRVVAVGGGTSVSVLLVAIARRRVVEGGVSGRGRPTEISVEAVFVAASSVVVGRRSSRRGFFLAGIDNGAAILCGGGATYQDSERFAAFLRTVNVRFRFGSSLTVSVGMETSAWSVGFCISMRYSAVRRDFVVCLYALQYLSIRSARMIQCRGVIRRMIETRATSEQGRRTIKFASRTLPNIQT